MTEAQPGGSTEEIAGSARRILDTALASLPRLGIALVIVAIGFAFQDSLENTLAGVLLLFRQPFRSGDQIEVDERSGTVEAITIRETRIKTFDGQLVLIPNRDVHKSVIRVQTHFELRRLEPDLHRDAVPAGAGDLMDGQHGS